VQRQRNPDIRDLRVGTAKIASGDAKDREADSVEHDITTRDARVGTEEPLPGRVADDGHGFRRVVTAIGREDSPEGCPCAEARQIVV